jgi:ethanolamine utilization protein EutL
MAPRALVPLRPTLLGCRQLDDVSPALAAAWFTTPGGASLGLVTVDQDDSTYIALDEATKHAAVDVAFARSFYAGSKHASGPYSGEILGVVRGGDPDDVEEALWVIKEHLRERVCFHTFSGEPFAGKDGPAFLAHVVSETGSFLSAEAGVARGDPIAYLIAPPLEAAVAVDAALKAADVALAKWIPPPSETNFAGAFLSGALAAVEAARDAFVDAVFDVGTRPLLSARRPQRLRR